MRVSKPAAGRVYDENTVARGPIASVPTSARLPGSSQTAAYAQ